MVKPLPVVAGAGRPRLKIHGPKGWVSNGTARVGRAWMGQPNQWLQTWPVGLNTGTQIHFKPKTMASNVREKISHADLAKDFGEFHERAVELSNDIQHLLDNFVLDESSLFRLATPDQCWCASVSA